MARRAGMSLTEVLVALFIMALGTIAILTLFPLGAIQMGQALKDDRTAQSATQADAFMRTYWKQFVGEPLTPTSLGSTTTSLDPFWNGFTNPGVMGIPAQSALIPVPGSATGVPSYPVVIDPMGFVARTGINQSWVVTVNPAPNSPTPLDTNLLRQNLSVIASSSQPAAVAYRMCSLLDGFGYTVSGTANPTNGVSAASGPIDRESRYNWLWVLQQSDVTAQTSANMTIVVFNKRANQFAPTTSEQVFVPTYCNPLNGTTNPTGDTRIQFSSGVGNFPPVQKGDWLMDATVTTLDPLTNLTYVPPSLPPTPSPLPQGWAPQPGIRNANFYRVVSLTDNGAGSVDIELQTPIQADTGNPGTQGVPVYQRRFIYLAGVAEVFVRNPLSYP